MHQRIVKMIFVLISISISIGMNGQDQELSKKEQKRKDNDEKMKVLYEILESRKFIVEASLINGKSGEVFTVQPTTNFFFLDSLNSTLQLSMDGLIGWNGIGGVTMDGKVDRYDLKELKSGKPITLVGSIMERIGGNSQFTIYVYSSGMANVEVSGNWGNRITFQGRLFKLADSKVYKGMPLN